MSDILFDNDLFILPQNNDGVVIDLQMRRIWCSMPSAKHTISIKLSKGVKQLTLKLPSYIWLQSFGLNDEENIYTHADYTDCRCKVCVKYPRFYCQFKILCLLNQATAAGFTIGNVEAGGNICWGQKNKKNFLSMRAVHIAFWDTVFNMDLNGGYGHLSLCKNRAHTHQNINCLLVDATIKIISCSCCMRTCECPCDCGIEDNYLESLKDFKPQSTAFYNTDISYLKNRENVFEGLAGCDGVFISQNQYLLDTLNFKKKLNWNDSPIIVGWAYSKIDYWEIFINEEDSFILDKKNINILDTNGRATKTAPEHYQIKRQITKSYTKYKQILSKV